MIEAASISETLVNFYQTTRRGATTQKTAIFRVVNVHVLLPVSE
jgi:hypothetical protein